MSCASKCLRMVVALLCCLCMAMPCEAKSKRRKPRPKVEEQETVKEIMAGITSSFALPLRDLLKKEYPSEWRNLVSEFSGGFSFSQPIEPRTGGSNAGTGTEGEQTFNQSYSASLKWNPLSYWFASVNFVGYVNDDLQQPWHPDFTYTLGYSDWHPYTFGLTYSNYGGNRLNPDRSKGEKYSTVEEGTIGISWSYVIPEKIQRIFVVGSEGGLGGSLGLSLTPRWTDSVTQERKQWKKVLSASFKWTIWRWIYINGSVFYYPDPSSQQPWNPDFTWGFGYFDWHPGTLVLQYNNYSGNRFPWNDNTKGTGRFRDGSFSISMSWSL